jgi:hypothetical protein
MAGAWLSIGVRVAKAIILGAGIVENAGTTHKGDSKRALALQFAEQAMGLCGDSAMQGVSDEVQEAMRKYNDAYVELQNVLAKSGKP